MKVLTWHGLFFVSVCLSVGEVTTVSRAKLDKPVELLCLGEVR